MTVSPWGRREGVGSELQMAVNHFDLPRNALLWQSPCLNEAGIYDDGLAAESEDLCSL